MAVAETRETARAAAGRIELRRTEGADSPLRLVFWALLAGCVLWIASLPVFPSQDGPMHLYYAQILRGMLHHSPAYAGYYAVRTWLTVYCLYYYLLAGLIGFMPPVAADKLVACLVVVLFSTGFRALARRLGPMGEVASLFIFPVIISWPLLMGFLSFTLGASVGLFALALWFGPVRAGFGWRCRAGYLALLLVMMLTHPVPLLLVLLVSGGELLVRVAARGQWNRADRQALVLLGVGAMSTLFVLRFMDARRMAYPAGSIESSAGKRLGALLRLHSFGLYTGRSPTVWAYDAMLYAVLLGATAVAVRSWRSGEARRSDVGLWLAAIGALALLFPWIPEAINGAAYFADRLVMLLWVGALLAVAGCGPAPSPRLRGMLAMAAAGCVLLLLGNGERLLRPAARREAAIERVTLPAMRARAGIGLRGRDGPRWRGLTFDPAFWAAARPFRRERALMVNPPWLDLPILPLADGGQLLTRRVSARILDDPRLLLPVLPRVIEDRRVAGQAPLDFVLSLDTADRRNATEVQAELTGVVGGPWRCDSGELLMLCRPAGP